MSPGDVYNQTITILNKYPRSDNGTSSDIWYKSVITNAYINTKSVSGFSGTSIVIGEKHTVLIPFSDFYKQYLAWKDTGAQIGYFTMSQGDYVIEGTVPETVTASNVVAIAKSYNAIQVKSIMEAKDRNRTYVQLKLEGV